MDVIKFRTGQTLAFTYTNHKGVVEDRDVIFLAVTIATETTRDYYEPGTYLLHCYCLTRQDWRSFNPANIHAGTLRAF